MTLEHDGSHPSGLRVPGSYGPSLGVCDSDHKPVWCTLAIALPIHAQPFKRKHSEKVRRQHGPSGAGQCACPPSLAHRHEHSREACKLLSVSHTLVALLLLEAAVCLPHPSYFATFGSCCLAYTPVSTSQAYEPLSHLSDEHMHSKKVPRHMLPNRAVLHGSGAGPGWGSVAWVR